MASESQNFHIDLPQMVARFVQSLPSNLIQRISSNAKHAASSPSPTPLSSSLGLCVPSLIANAPLIPLPMPFSIPDSQRGSPVPVQAAAPFESMPSSLRVSGLNPSSKGGPAFVGQVYTMCNPSGTGLMAVTSHLDIPFLSARAPEWVKKMLAVITKNEKSGPMFRFFMDLGDAVKYVKKLNIPSTMVCACRLDVAYEHFKEKPNMFQFVPNEKQVKEANKLLKMSRNTSRRLKGVPVFAAQNLNIAIATVDGIKWYTPYFFDKSLLDNILETSVDQHFHTLIQNRQMQRRRDVIDDGLAAEMTEENMESLFEPPELQDMLDEMGHPSIPLSVISKAAEIQLLDAVDNALLGKKWLRKAIGIQPKVPYVVDSFEERSAASFQRAMDSTRSNTNSIIPAGTGSSGIEFNANESNQSIKSHSPTVPHFHFPLQDWFLNPWSKLSESCQNPDNLLKPNGANTRMKDMDGDCMNQHPPNPLLPKITMVGISTSESGLMNRASLKKTIVDLTKELEQTGQKFTHQNIDRDPLFVANVGDFSGLTKAS